MKYFIRSSKNENTEAIKNYIEEKLNKLNKYFENPDEIEASILTKQDGRMQRIEVTIPTPHFTLRNEVSEEDLYAAIDLVSDKLERQIRKNKTRLKKQNIDNKYKDFNFDYELLNEEESSEDD